MEEGVAVRGLKGARCRSFPSTEAILEAVATGRVKAGYVISTRGPWLAHERWPGKLAFLPAAAIVDCFPICAAVRKSDRDLKDAIDRAWDELDRSGRLARSLPAGTSPTSPPRLPRRGKSQAGESIRAASFWYRRAMLGESLLGGARAWLPPVWSRSRVSRRSVGIESRGRRKTAASRPPDQPERTRLRMRRPWRKARPCFAACAAAATAGPAAAAKAPT